ncbi:MAG TPA: hypothetical protein DCX07_05130 [Phycisphaerales bacterium]|nr:hypothetical protein [Phycisphaerales bacterium]
MGLLGLDWGLDWGLRLVAAGDWVADWIGDCVDGQLPDSDGPLAVIGRRQVFRTMITLAAWSKQASGTAARRLSGGFMLAVGGAAAGGRAAPKPAPAGVGGCDDRERFEWGCSWGAIRRAASRRLALRQAQGPEHGRQRCPRRGDTGRWKAFPLELLFEGSFGLNPGAFYHTVPS